MEPPKVAIVVIGDEILKGQVSVIRKMSEKILSVG